MITHHRLLGQTYLPLEAYYPGSHRIHMQVTDRSTGQLLGVQRLGHRHAEIAKRVDIVATANLPQHDLHRISTRHRLPLHPRRRAWIP